MEKNLINQTTSISREYKTLHRFYNKQYREGKQSDKLFFSTILAWEPIFACKPKLFILKSTKSISVGLPSFSDNITISH